ncbi:RluA family pseudouridine synthase [Aerococcaceae bacterium zg-ZJ1578]|uniref:RluA family pseudouridine synthase n=1 Tax=Aerococcaceae bacterium zg-252 TaxID=2796928 RepID=UPI001A288160|nr:RluA family pseudouridine synthase [Aerococcaceae bacterium zg-1578]MBR7928265.1 RluA family pseudouridine synthase [Aerococcaceae bacterium zg-ZUI334]
MAEFKLEGQAGRLDKLLVELMPGESRSTIQKLIKQGLVSVNGRAEKANFQLVGDEVIEVQQANQAEVTEEIPALVAENIPLDIVFEDDDVIVINKPAGMVVHPSKGHYSGTLVHGLLYHLGHQNLAFPDDSVRPGLVHRIDKDTSGLLVVAKNNFAHQLLSEQLENHSMGRTYVALVHGMIKEPEGTIEVPIRRDQHNRLRWSAHQDGKYALTHFKVLERFSDSTLVELKLETGRTHQIRVHMEYIGHPLVGDPVYRVGVGQLKGPLTRMSDGQLLHARAIQFKHPITDELLQFEVPLPEHFTDVLKTLTSIES